MRIIFVFLFSSFFFIGSVLAQDVAAPTSDSLDDENNRKPHQDMLFIDLTWDRLFGLPEGVEQQWFGRGVSTGLLYDHPFREDGRISGAVGLAFTSHNYYMNALATRYDSAGTNYAEFTVTNDTIFNRGKISINYLDVPFELRFRSKEDAKGNRWKMAIGGRVGYLVNVHEKIINKQNIKIKTYDYPHVTQWRYGVSARVGYGAFMISAFYSLSPFFESSNSLSDQHSFSVGLSLFPF
jgi:hypothetical protein